jgi:integrase/recombinase XerD
MKLEFWPVLDRAAWVIANEAGDRLDPGGAGAHWASATRRGIMQANGRWLTFLTYDRPSLLRLPFVDRIMPEPIGAYISHLERFNASGTVWVRISLLADAIAAMAPEADLRWLRRVIARLHRKIRPFRLKRHKLVGTAELFAFGMETMAVAETASVPEWRRAQRYRDGLMIALLAPRPLRRGNFTAIEMDRHLLHRGAGYQLRFAASEMKNRRRLEIPVPVALVGCLERYITVYRPVLCRRSRGGTVTTRLWVSSTGTALQECSVYDRIVKLTKARFGHAINPHLFRDCAATSIAEDDPEHVQITKEILGHTTLRTSERHYNHARSQQAIALYQAHVIAMRRTIRRSASPMNR